MGRLVKDAGDLTKKQMDKETRIIAAARVRIIEEFGDKLGEAETRLCGVCYRHGACRLNALCLDGSDCIYFKESE